MFVSGWRYLKYKCPNGRAVRDALDRVTDVRISMDVLSGNAGSIVHVVEYLRSLLCLAQMMSTIPGALVLVFYTFIIFTSRLRNSPSAFSLPLDHPNQRSLQSFAPPRPFTHTQPLSRFSLRLYSKTSSVYYVVLSVNRCAHHFPLSLSFFSLGPLFHDVIFSCSVFLTAFYLLQFITWCRGLCLFFSGFPVCLHPSQLLYHASS